MSFYKSIKLLPFERLTVWYSLLTTIIIFAFWAKLEQPIVQLIGRVSIVVGVIVIGWSVNRYFKNDRIAKLIRVMLQISLLPFWYPDIYEFNNLFPNLDHIFALLEQSIFGLQPAVEFSQLMPYKWFSEAIYFGYFAYYPMIVATVIYSFFVKPSELDRMMYVTMGAFFTFYLIFIFLPVAGPQFYYLVIGMDNVAIANFYSVGNYFKHQFEIMPGPGYADGFFYHAIEMIQSGGEHPIAAFPSSHVGVSTVLMLYNNSVNKKITLLLLPVYALLCCATVYIQAHYLIDVFAGWLAGGALYFLYNKAYRAVGI